MNWLTFPFGIHSDTIANRVSVISTPNSGNTFGWLRAFHVKNSLQNPYTSSGQCVKSCIGSKSVTSDSHG